MNMYEAVFLRKSTRKYCQVKLPIEVLKEIEKLCNESCRLYPHIDLQVHLVEEGERIQRIMSGIIGNYGKVIAPHYLVVTSERKDYYRENAGYALEQAVLQLTSMGIATCWLGGHVRKELLKEILSISDDRECVFMISIGYPLDREKFLRKDLSEAKRKEISEFVTGQPDAVWMKIMEAVRIAPSAANSQPWRFVFDGKKVQVFCAMPGNFLMKKFLGAINKVDMGIALAHIKVAAEHLGKNVRFVKTDVVRQSDSEYIISVEEM